MSPAFPHPSGAQGCDGLTKREWYASIALISLMPNSGRVEDKARDAFKMADAMIKEANDENY